MMTLTRWKEIDKIVRNPSFSLHNESKWGVSDVEFDEFCKVRPEYSRKIDKQIFMRIILCIMAFLGFFLVVLPVSLSMVHTYFEKQALENFTGKHLNYWDVFWAGSKVRAISDLQDAPNYKK